MSDLGWMKTHRGKNNQTKNLIKNKQTDLSGFNLSKINQKWKNWSKKDLAKLIKKNKGTTYPSMTRDQMIQKKYL